MKKQSSSRQTLGRGLAALLENADRFASPEESLESAEFSYIPLSSIVPNPHQPRRYFDEILLEELAHSIREKGVLQPLLVRAGESGQYEILAGERRWRASKLAGLDTVPCRLLSADQHEMMEVGLLENIQRQDLNPIEEGMGYQYLMDHFSYTQEKLAHRLGKSRSHIANVLRVLSLPQEVQAFVSEGRLSLGHAKVLASAKDVVALAGFVVDQGLNVRQTEDLVQSRRIKETIFTDVKERSEVEIQKPGLEKEGFGEALWKDSASCEGALLSQHLSVLLGTPVTFKSTSKNQEIRLTFKDFDELERFIDRIQSALTPSED